MGLKQRAAVVCKRGLPAGVFFLILLRLPATLQTPNKLKIRMLRKD
jgi:hypothetical protein